jgi:hypothetical protein
MSAKKSSQNSDTPTPILIIPELEHTEREVLNALTSVHSRRAYKHAIDKFIAWYCSEPRLGFNHSVVLRTARSLNLFNCRLPQ